MDLSLRMQQVVSMVEPCQVAADIGCDHGYISMELVQKKKAQQVIAMDVRTGPLSRAEAHIRQKQLQEWISCRLSDGLEGLRPGEADTIIISGMGGPLMIDILERGKDRRLGTELLVLQPQSDIPEVRRYLHRIGYEIVKEAMLKEDNKYYTVMQGKPERATEGTLPIISNSWSVVEYQYGKDLLEQRSSILYSYLEKENQNLIRLREHLLERDTEKARQRIQELEEQLEWNREARGYYGTENDNAMA